MKLKQLFCKHSYKNMVFIDMIDYDIDVPNYGKLALNKHIDKIKIIRQCDKCNKAIVTEYLPNIDEFIIKRFLPEWRNDN